MCSFSSVAAVLFLAIGADAAPPASEPAAATKPNIFESPTPPVADSEIDRLVFARLSALGIKPRLCSDSAFVRRIYLDVIGTLPTAEEARTFIRDTDPNKRRALIDRLLERDEYPTYWAMKWGDILRIKAEFPVNLWPNAAQAYHRWVRASIASNKSYDRFVREMITSSGSNFRNGPVNFYRAIQDRTPPGIATAVALTFMGARTDSWPKGRLEGMAVFFSQIGYKATREWKEEIVFWDPDHTSPLPGDGISKEAAQAFLDSIKTKKGKAPWGVFPDGTRVQLPPGRDPRELFEDWLVHPKNPWFIRAFVNRAWSWIFGRGIVHEPDDIRPDNPPSNPELLNYLAKYFIETRCDIKGLFRTIFNSSTYQLASTGHPNVPEAQAEAQFANYILRRLEAEVLIDAVNKVTGTNDLYTSAIPEPFTYIPADQPAIAIADGSISSPFLTLFGRSARATGMENERINKPVASQWLHMLNSSHIQRKLEAGPKLRALFEQKKKTEEIIDDLYLTILSRYPTAEELEGALEYGRPPVIKPAPAGSPTPTIKVYQPKRREDWIDLAWSLINSTEFLYRH